MRDLWNEQAIRQSQLMILASRVCVDQAMRDQNELEDCLLKARIAIFASLSLIRKTDKIIAATYGTLKPPL